MTLQLRPLSKERYLQSPRLKGIVGGKSYRGQSTFGRYCGVFVAKGNNGCSKYAFFIKIAVLPLQKNTVAAYSKIFAAFGYFECITKVTQQGR